MPKSVSHFHANKHWVAAIYPNSQCQCSGARLILCLTSFLENRLGLFKACLRIPNQPSCAEVSQQGAEQVILYLPLLQEAHWAYSGLPLTCQWPGCHRCCESQPTCPTAHSQWVGYMVQRLEWDWKETQEGETVDQSSECQTYKVSKPRLAVARGFYSNTFHYTVVSAYSVFDEDLPSREHKEVHEPGEDGWKHTSIFEELQVRKESKTQGSRGSWQCP